MPSLNDAIVAALSPGIGLTSVIFFNNSLQSRFIYITGRARELNKEARQLMAEDPVRHAGRLESIERQVQGMMARSRRIRHSVLVVDIALLAFIATILELLVLAVLDRTDLHLLPVSTFGLGFFALGAASIYSSYEMAFSQRTLVEDSRSSFAAPAQQAERVSAD